MWALIRPVKRHLGRAGTQPPAPNPLHPTPKVFPRPPHQCKRKPRWVIRVVFKSKVKDTTY